MCLAVPMKLVEVSEGGAQGVADLEGARTDVNLALIDAAAVGDFVIVHAGFAIERLDQVEAEARLALFAEAGMVGAGQEGAPIAGEEGTAS